MSHTLHRDQPRTPKENSETPTSTPQHQTVEIMVATRPIVKTARARNRLQNGNRLQNSLRTRNSRSRKIATRLQSTTPTLHSIQTSEHKRLLQRSMEDLKESPCHVCSALRWTRCLSESIHYYHHHHLKTCANGTPETHIQFLDFP